VLIRTRTASWTIVRDVSWGVLPLVAGLFVLVRALDQTGLVGAIGAPLRGHTAGSEVQAAWAAGTTIAFVSNLVNNLPAGLVAGAAVQSAHAPDAVTRAILIGVTRPLRHRFAGDDPVARRAAAGRAERRRGQVSEAGHHCIVMPPALALALALAGALMWG
jgi:arsenical pump membrane protein